MLSDSSDIAMTVVMDVVRFIRRSNDRRDGYCLIRPPYRWPLWWILSDSSDVAMTVMIVWPSWLVALKNLSEGCDILGFFSNNLTFRLDRLCRSVVRVPPISSFNILLRIERPILTLDRLFDDEQYLTQWRKVTVRYALFIYSYKVCTMVLRVLWM